MPLIIIFLDLLMDKLVYHIFSYTLLNKINYKYIYMSAGSTIVINNNQNITFFSNPSITYFKSVYRKHTKFSITYKEETADKNFGDNNTEIPIELNFDADLLCDISLKVSVNNNGNDVICRLPNDISLFLIDNIKIDMRGKLNDFDILSKDYINFQAMLDNPKSLNSTYSFDSSTGEVTCNSGNNYQNMALCGGVQRRNNDDHATIKKMNAIIPLPFAFSKSIGNAIPLCALDMTKIKPTIVITGNNPSTTNEENKFIIIDSGSLEPLDQSTSDFDESNNKLRKLFKYSTITKYVFLSDDEKNRLTNSKLEYLYERVDLLNNDTGTFFSNTTQTNDKININNLNNNVSIKKMYLYNKLNVGNFNKLQYKIFINNQPLFTEFFNHEFFSKIEVLNKYKGCIYNGSNTGNVLIDNNIAMIDFSLKDSEGPTGSISSITNTIDLNIKPLDDDDNTYNIKIFICSYYVLTINNGEIRYVFN